MCWPAPRRGRQTVATWRKRFAERGPDGLLDEPRPGAPRRITGEQVERAVVTTLESTPANATHWNTRSLAQAVGPGRGAEPAGGWCGCGTPLLCSRTGGKPSSERTAPVLPMRPGQVERYTHDYVRHGTTDLFAALDVKSGTVIDALPSVPMTMRHRPPEV